MEGGVLAPTWHRGPWALSGVGETGGRGTHELLGGGGTRCASHISGWVGRAVCPSLVQSEPWDPVLQWLQKELRGFLPLSQHQVSSETAFFHAAMGLWSLGSAFVAALPGGGKF